MTGNAKGTINSGGTNGNYTVTVEVDRARVDAEIANNQTKITSITTDLIPNQEAALTEIETAVTNLKAKLNLEIGAIDPALGDEGLNEVRKAQKAYNAKLNEFFVAQRTLRNLKLNKAGLEQRNAWLTSNTPTPQSVSAWCADLTENLSGVVALIFPNNDPTKAPIIAPGYGGGAAWINNAILQPAAAAHPAAAWFNRAAQPAAQKSLPTYRIGTITALDTVANTADVSLDTATGEQNINLNKTGTLADVPVAYMTCDSEAFALGDKVVVEFGQNQTNPQVIGFEDNPKPCTPLPQVYLFRTDATNNWLYKYDPEAPGFDLSGAGVGYIAMCYAAAPRRFGKQSTSAAYIESDSGSLTGELEAGAGDQFALGGYHGVGHQTTDKYGFAWRRPSNSFEVGVKIFNKADNSVAHSFNAAFTQHFDGTPIHIRMLFNASRVVVLQIQDRASNPHRYKVKLYDLSGNLIADLLDADVDENDYLGPPLAGGTGREENIALTADRVYVGDAVYDLDGNSRGSLPSLPDIHNQNFLDRPSHWGCIAADNDHVCILEGWYHYDKAWDGFGAWAGGDGLASYYEYQIDKSGPVDIYTQINTAEWNEGGSYVYHGLMTDWAQI